MKILLNLGEELQACRKQVGMTQAELARLTDVRQESISRFERGRGSDFSLVKLLRLAQAVGYDLELVALKGNRPTLSEVLDEVRASANTGPDSR
jgi:transcriptional regulator with XRE-family HTH domain